MQGRAEDLKGASVWSAGSRAHWRAGSPERLTAGDTGSAGCRPLRTIKQRSLHTSGGTRHSGRTGIVLSEASQGSARRTPRGFGLLCVWLHPGGMASPGQQGRVPLSSRPREVRYQGGRRPASPRQARPLSSWQPKCYSADQGLQRGKVVWRVLSRQRRQTWILPCLLREQAPVVSNPTLSPKVTAQDRLINFALGVSCRSPCSLPWRGHTSPFWFWEASCLHFNS